MIIQDEFNLKECFRLEYDCLEVSGWIVLQGQSSGNHHYIMMIWESLALAMG